MNPYMNQGNHAYLQNIYGQPSYIPPEMQSMVNVYSPQKISSLQGSPAMSSMSPQQPQLNPIVQQQMNSMQWNNPPQSIQDQQRQQFMLMQQQKNLMLRNQQLSQSQSPVTTPVQPNTSSSILYTPSNHTELPISNIPNAEQQNYETSIDSKKVDAILSLNIEIIRLCIESQQSGANVEPNLPLYKAKLQSNLTYLATMADMSMAKPGEDHKPSISPPDFSPLPPPKSDIGKRIHELYNITQNLFKLRKQSDASFINSPQLQQESPSIHRMNTPLQQQQQQQQMLRQQHNVRQQQQYLNSSTSSGNNTPNSSISSNIDPQTLLRQQNQQLMRQQHQIMSNSNLSSPSSLPNDLLAANGMMNPGMINSGMMMNPGNMMLNPNMMTDPNNMMMYSSMTEDPNSYNNVMMMLQRLQ